MHRCRIAETMAKRGRWITAGGIALSLASVVGVVISKNLTEGISEKKVTWGSAAGNLQLGSAACYFVGLPSVAIGIARISEANKHLGRAVFMYNSYVRSQSSQSALLKN
jgi:hypothetical protein